MNCTESAKAPGLHLNVSCLLSSGCWPSAVDHLLVGCFLFFLGKKSWQQCPCTCPAGQSNLTGPHHGEFGFYHFYRWEICYLSLNQSKAGLDLFEGFVFFYSVLDLSCSLHSFNPLLIRLFKTGMLHLYPASLWRGVVLLSFHLGTAQVITEHN